MALVIGNNAYENVPQLQKAVNDAEAISQELAKLGFDVVSAENVGHRAISRALVELENKIESGDTALIYFAGHGFAVEGSNYLLPVDVPEARRLLCRQRPVGPAAGKGRGHGDSHPRRLPRQSFRAARKAQHWADARADPYGSGCVRAVLGGTRTVSARPPERYRRQSKFRVHPQLLKEIEQPGLSMVQIAKRIATTGAAWLCLLFALEVFDYVQLL